MDTVYRKTENLFPGGGSAPWKSILILQSYSTIYTLL